MGVQSLGNLNLPSFVRCQSLLVTRMLLGSLRLLLCLSVVLRCLSLDGRLRIGLARLRKNHFEFFFREHNFSLRFVFEIWFRWLLLSRVHLANDRFFLQLMFTII